MKRNTIPVFLTLALLGVLATSCNGFSMAEPTATLTPTSTLTPTPTLTPTSTLTATPTETSTPAPENIGGTIYLQTSEKKPFVTTVELRVKESFKLVNTVETDANGAFIFADVQPGSYQFWVLLSANSSMIPGCSDVLLPDSSWGMGIMLGKNKAMTMADATMGGAVLFATTLKSTSSLASTGIYAVLLEVDLASASNLEIVFTCK